MRVLIVNDDAASRGVLRTVLDNAGYSIVEATSKEGALDMLARQAAPMIVLLDFAVHRWDGAGVLAEAVQIPAAKRHAFVLMMLRDETAPLTFARALTELAVTLVPKPFSTEALLTAIKEAAESLPPDGDETEILPTHRSS